MEGARRSEKFKHLGMYFTMQEEMVVCIELFCSLGYIANMVYEFYVTEKKNEKMLHVAFVLYV